jgi:high-affinity nickel permease
VLGLLLSALALGFRHGFDVDHVAAISDIGAGTAEKGRAIVLATVYAAGHALVVIGLGLVAVVAGGYVPEGLDTLMGRIVGGTLVILGLYVFWSLITHGQDFRLRSRWSLVFDVFHRRHRHPDSVEGVGPLGCFLIGCLHGIGAETPTQILLFAATAGMVSVTSAVPVLLFFVGGLFLANTAVAVITGLGFDAAAKRKVPYRALGAAVGAASLLVGLSYLFA